MNETLSKIRLLLVDDQKLFVESLRKLLEIEADEVVVVATAKSGAQAVELSDRLRPDMVLLDVRMPGMDGVQTVKILKERHPEITVIMLTTFDDDVYIYDALALGAEGYLLKDIPPNELIAAIHAVREGGVTVSPAVARKLVERGIEPGARSDAAPPPEQLTKREREVLTLMVRGHDNVEIATVLHLSEQTVRNYVSTIYSKLGVEKRSQAIRAARELNL